MARGERVVEFLGLEPMCFGEAGNGQQQRNEWLHYGTSPIRYTEVFLDWTKGRIHSIRISLYATNKAECCRYTIHSRLSAFS
jgi:hypothetical protein